MEDNRLKERIENSKAYMGNQILLGNQISEKIVKDKIIDQKKKIQELTSTINDLKKDLSNLKYEKMHFEGDL